MKFGVQVNCFYRTTWDDIRASIETMEAGRWNSLWFADHFVPPGPRGARMKVARRSTSFTLIAVAAGMTEKLKLGHLVLGNTYRNPALVAKMAATLDQASKGRFVLGIGASWCEREHEAYGWDFPSMKRTVGQISGGVRAHPQALYRRWACRLQRPILPARPGAAVARLLSETSYSDHGRRTRRAPHIAHPGHARRHLQFQRWGARGLSARDVSGKLSAQARRVGEALRGTSVAIRRRSRARCTCR